MFFFKRRRNFKQSNVKYDMNFIEDCIKEKLPMPFQEYIFNFFFYNFFALKFGKEIKNTAHKFHK